MHLIVCLEDRDGMYFGDRRLSSDRVLTEYILNLTSGSKLWMSAYSATLFPAEKVCVAEDFLHKAGEGDYCFLETTPLTDSLTLESVTIFHWNRRYPFTQVFPRKLLQDMHLESSRDFPGNSHDKITVERYIP